MFHITSGKGFHITFENGWTVSVQFGPGNYSDHYNNYDFTAKGRCDAGVTGSKTAEVWCWNEITGKHWPENPFAYQSPDDVSKILSYACLGVFPLEDL